MDYYLSQNYFTFHLILKLFTAIKFISLQLYLHNSMHIVLKLNLYTISWVLFISTRFLTYVFIFKISKYLYM